jgi:predicted membrane channel-forming protein YqfA (hemolysin III family)
MTMKYGRHPQKFDNPDPALQQEWLNLKEVLCDNEYMIGYKIMVGQPVTPNTVFNILTTLHTDTTNIWTHLIGAIALSYTGLIFPFPVCIVSFSSSATCFLSAIYHTFRNYSRKLYDVCLCLDVSSIGIEIFGAFFTDLINLFGTSHPTIAWRFATAGAALCVATLAGIPFILRWKLYWLRTFVYACESALCIPVFAQKYLVDGFDERMSRVIGWRVLALVTAGMGVAVRSAHIPERFLPRTVFQSLFHSHCFFHLIALVSVTFSILSAQAEL